MPRELRWALIALPKSVFKSLAAMKFLRDVLLLPPPQTMSDSDSSSAFLVFCVTRATSRDRSFPRLGKPLDHDYGRELVRLRRIPTRCEPQAAPTDLGRGRR